MPHNLEAERAVLGAVLLDNGVLPDAQEILPAGDFFGDDHSAIFGAMLALKERGSAIDAITVAEMLRPGSGVQEAGRLQYLASLVDGLPRGPNVRHYARIVKGKAEMRRLARMAEDLRERAIAGEEDAATLVDYYRPELEAIGANGTGKSIQPLELSELLTMEMPAREWLIEGLLQKRDLGMIHAFRGIGKSRFAHGLAVAVAAGGCFLRFRAPIPAGVLLVDGELPREELQRLLAEAVAGSDGKLRAPLSVLSADLCGQPLRSLATQDGRRQVEASLCGVSLLILDSISTLCPGSGPENDAESWEGMQSWLLELRRKGLTVLLVHHDGKGGNQRGTSKREDVLSQVLQLRRPHDYRPSQGARFEVHFTKSRGLVGKAASPFEAALVTDSTGAAVWTLRTLEDTRARQVQQLSDEGLSQREIAKQLKIGLATVNRALKRARERWGAAEITDATDDQ